MIRGLSGSAIEKISLRGLSEKCRRSLPLSLTWRRRTKQYHRQPTAHLQGDTKTKKKKKLYRALAYKAERDVHILLEWHFPLKNLLSHKYNSRPS